MDQSSRLTSIGAGIIAGGLPDSTEVLTGAAPKKEGRWKHWFGDPPELTPEVNRRKYVNWFGEPREEDTSRWKKWFGEPLFVLEWVGKALQDIPEELDEQYDHFKNKIQTLVYVGLQRAEDIMEHTVNTLDYYFDSNAPPETFQEEKKRFVEEAKRFLKTLK